MHDAAAHVVVPKVETSGATAHSADVNMLDTTTHYAIPEVETSDNTTFCTMLDAEVHTIAKSMSAGQGFSLC